jgi:hypothetical protein
MIYKYHFSISGDNLYPEQIISKIQGDFIIDSYFNPTNMKFENSPDEYGYGGVSFWHPKKFSTEETIIPYEKGFIEFIHENYSLFIENGVDDLQIFIEIYFDGGQCNFEIFNKELLKKLANFGVSLPISVYVLKDAEIQEWENEIKLAWEANTL